MFVKLGYARCLSLRSRETATDARPDVQMLLNLLRDLISDHVLSHEACCHNAVMPSIVTQDGTAAAAADDDDDDGDTTSRVAAAAPPHLITCAFIAGALAGWRRGRSVGRSSADHRRPSSGVLLFPGDLQCRVRRRADRPTARPYDRHGVHIQRVQR